VLAIATLKDNPINEQIRCKEMMVIGPNGEQLGIKSKQDALTLAGYAGFDLVLMSDSGSVPVCKIMDYNKFKYEKNKKQKDALKKQRESNKETKEYQLSATIDVHDFETRRKNSEKYLKDGHKIKVTIRFKGRQMAHTEVGEEIMLRFAEALSDVADMESKPSLEGRTMIMMLAPKKEK
jgi:translation initiation factor IF-3